MGPGGTSKRGYTGHMERDPTQHQEPKTDRNRTLEAERREVERPLAPREALELVLQERDGLFRALAKR